MKKIIKATVLIVVPLCLIVEAFNDVVKRRGL